MLRKRDEIDSTSRYHPPPRGGCRLGFGGAQIAETAVEQTTELIVCKKIQDGFYTVLVSKKVHLYMAPPGKKSQDAAANFSE